MLSLDAVPEGEVSFRLSFRGDSISLVELFGFFDIVVFTFITDAKHIKLICDHFEVKPKREDGMEKRVANREGALSI
jgi:hypothetical protein